MFSSGWKVLWQNGVKLQPILLGLGEYLAVTSCNVFFSDQCDLCAMFWFSLKLGELKTRRNSSEIFWPLTSHIRLLDEGRCTVQKVGSISWAKQATLIPTFWLEWLLHCRSSTESDFRGAFFAKTTSNFMGTCYWFCSEFTVNNDKNYKLMRLPVAARSLKMKRKISLVVMELLHSKKKGKFFSWMNETLGYWRFI